VQNPEIKFDSNSGFEWEIYHQQASFEAVLVSSRIIFINKKLGCFNVSPQRESLFGVTEKTVNEWIEKLLYWQQLWQKILITDLGEPNKVSADIDLDIWNRDYHNSISESIFSRREILSTWNYKFDWGNVYLSPWLLTVIYDVDVQITNWEQLIEECEYRQEIQDRDVNPKAVLHFSHTKTLIKQLQDIFPFSDLKPQISRSGLVLRSQLLNTKVIIEIRTETTGDIYHIYRFDSPIAQDVDKHSLITTVKRFMETKHL
jgi:hypothetical protein